MRYRVADLHRIRARLSGARRDAERLLEARQRPLEKPVHPTAPVQSPELDRTLREKLETERDELEAALDRTDAERAEAERRVAALERELSAGRAPSEERQEEIEATCELLERELAAARLELEQARMGRDRARAELQEMSAELRKAQFLLDAERAGGDLPNEDGGGSRAERKRGASRREKRIAELEGELETERELRRDFELALELLQQQEADARLRAEEAERLASEPQFTPNGQGAPGTVGSPAETPVGAEPSDAAPEPRLGRPAEAPADGFGVPLEAFPIDEPDEDQEGVGKGSGRDERPSRHVPFRRRRRPAGG